MAIWNSGVNITFFSNDNGDEKTHRRCRFYCSVTSKEFVHRKDTEDMDLILIV